MLADCTVILSRGGLPGLVAAACCLQDISARSLIYLQLDERCRSGAAGLAHLEQQARHLGGARLLQGALTQPVAAERPAETSGESLPFRRGMMLISALSVASSVGAVRVIWPCQCGGDLETIAALTESVTLASHLAQMEQEVVPAIETPLLELNDRQFMELAMHLEVPWQLAWSCEQEGPVPCRVCRGCRRRQQLFAEVRLRDPAIERLRCPA